MTDKGKKQSSLDSFFKTSSTLSATAAAAPKAAKVKAAKAAATTSKKKKKEEEAPVALVAKVKASKPAATAPKQKKEKVEEAVEQKENASNADKTKKEDPIEVAAVNQEDDNDDTESSSSPPPTNKRKTPREKVENKRRRRIIDDDSDSDEDEQKQQQQQPQKATAPLAMEVEPEKEEDEQETTDQASLETKKQSEPATKKAPVRSKKSKVAESSPSLPFTSKPAKSTSDEKKEPELETASSSSSNPKKPAAAAKTKTTKASTTKQGQFPSDQQLLDQLPDSWKRSSTLSSQPAASMPYVILCETFSKIEAVTSRLQIQEELTTLFRQILLHSNHSSAPATDLYATIYLASNSVAPACQNVELGIGDSLLIKAIVEATGTSTAMVKHKYETVGDLGTVAQSFKGKQKTLGGFFASKKKATSSSSSSNLLTASDVLTVFRDIAQTKGSQSQKYKVERIKKLLVRTGPDTYETKYIIRGLQGKLRIGLAQSTVLISLAHALALTTPATVVAAAKDETEQDEVDDEVYPDEAKQYADPEQPVEKRLEAAVAIIKKAYSEVPSYDALLDAALKVPLENLHKACTLCPGIPVAPMLAKPTKSIQEVLKRLSGVRFTCEYKYDGERAQVHMLPDGTTKVFSRNLLDTSEKYPEVPEFVKEACKKPSSDDDDKAVAVTSYVMDAEVVAFDNKTGQLVPFQILSTRKKTEESADTAKVAVILQAFDLMYLNGKSLLRKSLAERRELLHQHFQEVPGKFQFATALDHEENGDTTVIEEFLDQAVKGQSEGLMIKTLDSNAMYEPSRRSLNWLKLKKDYLEGLGDSVDLCVLGAYHGRGKRTGVYGAYLLACYDTDNEQFQSVCKLGTGFSEEDLKNLAASLNEHVIPTKSSQYNVSDQLECDVWFDAVQVWEVKAADLSKSSAHRGAEGKTGEAGRGIGLRFPRFERVREDKKPEQATTSDQILEMYYEQDAIVLQDNDDDDGI